MSLRETVGKLADAGRVGKVNGNGVYAYAGDTRDPWDGLAACLGTKPSSLDETTVRERLLYVQSLEAIRTLEEGVVDAPDRRRSRRRCSAGAIPRISAAYSRMSIGSALPNLRAAQRIMPPASADVSSRPRCCLTWRRTIASSTNCEQRCNAQRITQGRSADEGHGDGRAGCLSNLALRDVPDPKPGPGQVLVRMRAASLNFRDLLTLDGKYGSMQKREDLILLSDGAGEIAEVGAGVREWKVGDRVVGCFFPHLAGWRGAGISAARRAGRTRRWRRVPVSRVRRATRSCRSRRTLSFVEAATLPCAAITAWNAVRVAHEDRARTYRTDAGDRRRLAVRAAIRESRGRHRDRDLVERREARSGCGRSGADHVINYREDAEWGKTARKLTGGRGVDLVVEVGGAGTIKQSIRASKLGGTIAVIGVVAGPSLDFPLPLITMNMLHVSVSRSATGGNSPTCCVRSGIMGSSRWWTRCFRWSSFPMR